MIELTLHYDATNYTPATSLVYHATVGSTRAIDAFVRIGDRKRSTEVEASIIELAFRYPQKCVSRAVLEVDSACYDDANGDGLIESPLSETGQSPLSILERLIDHLGMKQVDVLRQLHAPILYDLTKDLSAEQAHRHLFVASCGSTAADVHRMHGHNVLWASAPSGDNPNEVHRHLGGSVYCLFFRGQGRFHRVDPERGFETVPIQITDENSFQLIAIPPHLWYQPINSGKVDLQYFMIHEPAFDPSELLILGKNDCHSDWRFEF